VLAESPAKRSEIPWWLWPNVLALDAPLIALAWQELFASGFGISLEAAPRWALFCAVWAVYLADRWMDSRGRGDQQARHLFPRRHPFVIAFLTVTATAGGVLFALSLHSETLLLGALLGAVVGVYFVWNVTTPERQKVRLKEVVVSLVFAVGSALAAASEGGWNSLAFVASVLLFAILCFANSTLIDQIQKGILHPSLPLSQIAAAAAGLAAAAWLLLPLPPRVALALIVTGVLLALTRTVADRFGPRVAGIYADIALLSPVLMLV